MASKARDKKGVLALTIGALLLGAAAAYYLVPLASNSPFSPTPSSGVTSRPPLVLSGAVKMPATSGRVDHMAVDVGGGRLFVAIYGNNTVAVINLKAGKLMRSIGDLEFPQGVAFIPGADKLYVSNAASGTVDVFDANSLAPTGTVYFASDADNLRYDASSKLLYVGYGDGGIAAIDTGTNAVVHDFPLPGHPESFQVEAKGSSIYVNVPTSSLISVINKTTGRSILNHTLGGYSGNFPMALDESDGRLLVGTRNPSSLLIFDTSSWAIVGTVPIPADPDDISYDSAHGLIYVSSGLGYLEVIQQTDSNNYSVVQTIATGPGARTALFVPELNSVYVGVPPSTGQEAEVLVYTIQGS